MTAKVVCHLETRITRQTDYCTVPLSKVVYFKEHECWSAKLPTADAEYATFQAYAIM